MIGDESYKNPLVQSDIPEKVAAGVEGAYRGLLPTGVFNTLEETLGGASKQDIESRAAAHRAIAGATEFGGNVLRDTAAISIAGPAAMYGVAAANTAGEVAHEALNHDPELTTEHVASTLLREMLSAQIAITGGQVVDKVGRVLMSGAKSVAGRVMAGGFRAESLTATGELDAAAEKALQQGIFSKARAKALEVTEQAKLGIGDKMNSFLKPFDEIAKMRKLGKQIEPTPDANEMRRIFDWSAKESAKAEQVAVRPSPPGQPDEGELQRIMQWTDSETAKATKVATKSQAENEAAAAQEALLKAPVEAADLKSLSSELTARIAKTKHAGVKETLTGLQAALQEGASVGEVTAALESAAGSLPKTAGVNASRNYLLKTSKLLKQLPQGEGAAVTEAAVPDVVATSAEPTAPAGPSPSSAAEGMTPEAAAPSPTEVAPATMPEAGSPVQAPVAGQPQMAAAEQPQSAKFMDIEGEIGKRVDATLRQLEFTNSAPAQSALRKISKTLLNLEEPLTPTQALRIERMLRKAGNATAKLQKANGNTSGDNAASIVFGLRDEVKQLNNKFMAELNASPEEYRALEREFLAQTHIQDSIPNDILPRLKNVAYSAAGGYAVDQGAQALGVSKENARALGAAVGIGGGAMATGLISRAPAALLKDAVPVVAGSAAQGAYRVGAALSEFDKGIFKQILANRLGEKLGSVASKSLKFGVSQAVLDDVLPDHAVETLQHFVAHPDIFARTAQEHLDGAPIDEQTKVDAFHQLDQDMKYLSLDLPQANQLAPPGARSMPARKQVVLRRKLHALAHPQSALADPTPEGLSAIKERRQQTHSTYVQHIMDQAGPNIDAGTPARAYLDLLGADASVQQAGRDAQKLYAPHPMPQGRRQQRSTHVTINNHAATALDDVEKGSP